MLLKLLVFTLQKDILNVFDHESGIIWNMEISLISKELKRPIKNEIDFRVGVTQTCVKLAKFTMVSQPIDLG